MVQDDLLDKLLSRLEVFNLGLVIDLVVDWLLLLFACVQVHSYVLG